MKKSNWALLGVTVALVAFAYFYEYKKRNADEESKELDALVLKLKKDEISAFTLTHANEKLSLQKQGESWKILSPVIDDADTIQVDQFLDAVTREKTEIEMSDGALEAKVYGLEKPRAIFEFEANDKKAKIEIGDEAIRGKHYLRVDSGKEIILSSNQWQILAEKKLKDFRSRSLIRDSQIQSLEIEAAGKPKVVLTQNDDLWKIEGVDFQVDQPSVKAYIAQVQNMHIQDVESETQGQLTKYGLDKPVVTLRIQTKDNKDPLIVRMSGPQQKKSFIVVSNLKPVFQSFAKFADAFSKKPLDFRDREEPFQFSLADVIGVRTKGPQFDHRFIKKGEAWYLEKPDTKFDVDQNRLMSLLASIQGARVHEYLGEASFKSKKEIELLNKEGEKILRVELGDEIKGKRLLKTSKVDQVFTVDSVLIDTWPTSQLVKEKAATK